MVPLVEKVRLIFQTLTKSIFPNFIKPLIFFGKALFVQAIIIMKLQYYSPAEFSQCAKIDFNSFSIIPAWKSRITKKHTGFKATCV